MPGIGFDDELALSTRLRDALMARLGGRKIDLVITPLTDAAAKPFARLALAGADWVPAFAGTTPCTDCRSRGTAQALSVIPAAPGTL